MKFSLSQLADLRQLLKELSTGLNRLDFNENFIGFEKTVTLAAGETLKIRNELQLIPTKMLVLKQTGNGLLTAGTAIPWNLSHLYVINNGAVSVTATILFLK